MQTDTSHLEPETPPEEKSNSFKLDVYKAQRAHYTKLVETLYRILPFYIGITGTLWAYGLGIIENKSIAGSTIMFVASLISFLFAHILARYGANMDKNLESICRLEKELAVVRVSYPTDLTMASTKIDGARENNYILNFVNKIRNVRSHNAISIAFLSSGVLSFITSIGPNWGSILFYVSVIVLISVMLGMLESFTKKSKRASSLENTNTVTTVHNNSNKSPDENINP